MGSSKDSSSSSANANVSPRAEGGKVASVTILSFIVSAQNMFLGRDQCCFLTHHGTNGLVIRAAALVILAQGVTLAIPLRIKAILTAVQARLCRWNNRVKESGMSLLSSGFDTMPVGSWDMLFLIINASSFYIRN